MAETLNIPEPSAEELDAFYAKRTEAFNAMADAVEKQYMLKKGISAPTASPKKAHPALGEQLAELSAPGLIDGKSPQKEVFMDRFVQERVARNLEGRKNAYVTNEYLNKLAMLQEFGDIPQNFYEDVSEEQRIEAGIGQTQELQITKDKDFLEKTTKFRTNIEEYLKKGTLPEEFVKLVTDPTVDMSVVRFLGKQLEWSLTNRIIGEGDLVDDVVNSLSSGETLDGSFVDYAFSTKDYKNIDRLVHKWVKNQRGNLEAVAAKQLLADGLRLSLVETDPNATMTPSELLAKHGERAWKGITGQDNAVTSGLIADLQNVYGDQWDKKWVAYLARAGIEVAAAYKGGKALQAGGLGRAVANTGLLGKVNTVLPSARDKLGALLFVTLESLMFEGLDLGYEHAVRAATTDKGELRLPTKEDALVWNIYRDAWYNTYMNMGVLAGLGLVPIPFRAAKKGWSVLGEKINQHLYQRSEQKAIKLLREKGIAVFNDPLTNLAYLEKSVPDSQAAALASHNAGWGGKGPGSVLKQSIDPGKNLGDGDIIPGLEDLWAETAPSSAYKVSGDMGFGPRIGAVQQAIEEAIVLPNQNQNLTYVMRRGDKPGNWHMELPFQHGKFKYEGSDAVDFESVLGESGKIKGALSEGLEKIGAISPEAFSLGSYKTVANVRAMEALGAAEVQAAKKYLQGIWKESKFSAKDWRVFEDALIAMDEQGREFSPEIMRGAWDWDFKMIDFYFTKWKPMVREVWEYANNWAVSDLRQSNTKVIDFNIDGKGQYGVVERVSPEVKGDPGDYANTLYDNPEIAAWIKRFEDNTGIQPGEYTHPVSEITSGNKALVKVFDYGDRGLPFVKDGEYLHLVETNKIVDPETAVTEVGKVTTPVLSNYTAYVPRIYKKKFRHFVVEVNEKQVAASAKLARGDAVTPRDIRAGSFSDTGVKIHAATDRLDKALRYTQFNADAVSKEGSYFTVISTSRLGDDVGQTIGVGQLGNTAGVSPRSVDFLIDSLRTKIGLTDQQADGLRAGFAEAYTAPMLRHRKEDPLLEIIDPLKGVLEEARILKPRAAFMAKLESLAHMQGHVSPQKFVTENFERVAKKYFPPGSPGRWHDPIHYAHIPANKLTTADIHKVRALRAHQAWINTHLLNNPGPFEMAWNQITHNYITDYGINARVTDGAIEKGLAMLAPGLEFHSLSRTAKAFTAGSVYLGNLGSFIVQAGTAAINSTAMQVSANPLKLFGATDVAKLYASTAYTAMSYIPGVRWAKGVAPEGLKELRNAIDRSGILADVTGLVDIEGMGPATVQRIFFYMLHKGEALGRIAGFTAAHMRAQQQFKKGIPEAAGWFYRDGTLTDEGLKHVSDKAWAIFLDMRSQSSTRAGKGPLSVAGQFIIQPTVKVLEQLTYGRGLTKAEKARLWVFHTAVWGPNFFPGGETVSAEVAEEYTAISNFFKNDKYLADPGGAKKHLQRIRNDYADMMVADIQDPIERDKERKAVLNTVKILSGLEGIAEDERGAEWRVLNRLYMADVLENFRRMNGDSWWLTAPVARTADAHISGIADAWKYIHQYNKLSKNPGIANQYGIYVNENDLKSAQSELKRQTILAATRGFPGVNKVLRTSMALGNDLLWGAERKWLTSKGKEIGDVKDMKWGDYLHLLTGFGTDFLQKNFDFYDMKVADRDWLYDTAQGLMDLYKRDPQAANQELDKAMDIAYQQGNFKLGNALMSKFNQYVLDPVQYEKERAEWNGIKEIRGGNFSVIPED